ncbi:hypothetical protein EYR38_006744 [Pleurotus pulmonarius]|nr:hypothetical protein EYR38_006744 [Pleurotus pulmonarius]
MVRLLTRIPVLRAIVPRLATPILPISASLHPRLTLTQRPAQSFRLFTRFPQRFSSSPPSPKLENSDPTLPADATLTQRLKHLIKSYGWYALGVYFILSALDFGVAFAGIQLVGAEHVSRVAVAAKDIIARVLHSKPAEPGLDEVDSPSSSPRAPGQEGLYAMLVLAYTIHKTVFVPVRIGLTAAFTPRLVGWLRRRGWAGGAGTKRAANEMREMIRRKSRDRD